MTVRAALTVAASNEQPEWSQGRRLVEQHRVVMAALARDAAEHAGAVVPLPAVGDLALMLAAADRLWCEDTGDEEGSPEFWRGIATRLGSIARRQHANGAST